MDFDDYCRLASGRPPEPCPHAASTVQSSGTGGTDPCEIDVELSEAMVVCAVANIRNTRSHESMEILRAKKKQQKGGAADRGTERKGEGF